MKPFTALATMLITGLSICQPASGSESRVFVGYELGEMAFNNFKHFAGEIGYEINDRQTMRLAVVSVNLTERHLSSNEASIVDGDNVTGDWNGVDIYYDFKITKNFSISTSIGYHDSEYRHTILDESTSNNSPTIGLAASYGGDGVFGNTNLYWRFSLTGRYYLKPAEQTRLGDSVVNEIKTEVIPLIYVGYKF